MQDSALNPHSVMSVNDAAANGTSSTKRKVTLLLGIGIAVFPIVFSWFTLRSGYSKRARLIAFAWLLVYALIQGTIPNSNSSQQSKQSSLARSSLAKDVKRSIENYALASGNGICERFEDGTFIQLRLGESVPEGMQKHKTITGAYQGRCLVSIGGNANWSEQTYWFRIFTDSGRLRGSILLDNPARIQSELQSTGFQER